jgi:hypothetical protein
VSLILSVVLAVLCWYSNKSHGLGNDDGSTRLFIGWRYTPTIIAVLFTQALVQTAEGVERTEVFANTPLPIELKPRRDTYFHTISGFLFNASTSMWVSDAYVFVPFEQVADGTDRHQYYDGIWEAETEFFQLKSN